MERFPYFRLTAYQPTADCLASWFKHFEDLGTPCAIVKHDENSHFKSECYALWRFGQENLSEVQQAEANTEEFDGEIVRECNGFSAKMMEGAGRN